jgi:hypothetical protein
MFTANSERSDEYRDLRVKEALGNKMKKDAAPTLQASKNRF